MVVVFQKGVHDTAEAQRTLRAAENGEAIEWSSLAVPIVLDFLCGSPRPQRLCGVVYVV
jgi:hypothetical protein